MIRHRVVIAIAAIVAVLVLAAADANARAGGGFSGGSRGARTFSAPPATQTAPNAAAPVQRTLTQPGKAGTVGQSAARPGLFGGGLLGGLAAVVVWTLISGSYMFTPVVLPPGRPRLSGLSRRELTGSGGVSAS